MARKHDIVHGQLFRWGKLMSEGGKVAVRAQGPAVDASKVRALKKRGREPERLGRYQAKRSAWYSRARNTVQQPLIRESIDGGLTCGQRRVNA